MSEGPWKCFHCGETFTRKDAARVHFGADEGCTPACQIKASEGGLIRALRAAEADAWEARSACHAESAEGMRAWRSAESRHQMALHAMEELGFERGMAECRASIERLRRIVAFNGVHVMVPNADWQIEIDEAMRFVADHPETAA